MKLTLDRFHSAQADFYETALGELKSGRKRTHWIWFIFPQIQGLGRSSTAQYYEIQDRAEAMAYWRDPVLSGRLRELCQVLLTLNDPIEKIMGFPDNLKLRSCMTLFWLVTGDQVFRDVLDRFYDGSLDSYTEEKLSRQ